MASVLTVWCTTTQCDATQVARARELLGAGKTVKEVAASRRFIGPQLRGPHGLLTASVQLGNG
jgi:hypothetical protein